MQVVEVRSGPLEHCIGLEFLSRDAARCLVDILRVALATSSCRALVRISVFNGGGCTIAWSTRDGVVLALHSLRRKRQDVFVKARSYLVAHAIRMSVICVLRIAG